jgi:hypothetical protein
MNANPPTLFEETMVDHAWAENAMRCSAARIKELVPQERYSWAFYKIERERETLRALYNLRWGIG